VKPVSTATPYHKNNMKKNNRPALRTALILFIIFTAYLSCAKAEGILVATQPGENAEISGFDGKVTLWFSGNITTRTPTLIVFDAHGNRVDNGKPKLKVEARSELSVLTHTPLPAGVYVARYRVLTRDGLVISGIYKFAIKS
jgi:methionine-rich copper-binding protein CopC